LPLVIPPASQRNAEPIREQLERVLAPVRARRGLVLEIAAGSGYHAAQFAKAFPEVTWQPTDPDAGARDNIAAHVAAAGLANLRAPLALDVEAPWPVTAADAILCVNMIHISPWSATLALFAGAGKILAPGGVMVTYGPYSIDGDFLAPSNLDFDASLKSRNAAWGIRDVSDVARVASDNGLALRETIRMPANNLILVFGRASPFP
jgi:SAM-dependent methyltransferase